MIEQSDYHALSPTSYTYDNDNQSASTAPSMYIVQEEGPSSSDYQYTYQGYIGKTGYVNDTPTYEPYDTTTSDGHQVMESQDVGQYKPYKPVSADYAPKPNINQTEKVSL